MPPDMIFAFLPPHIELDDARFKRLRYMPLTARRDEISSIDAHQAWRTYARRHMPLENLKRRAAAPALPDNIIIAVAA